MPSDYPDGASDMVVHGHAVLSNGANAANRVSDSSVNATLELVKKIAGQAGLTFGIYPVRRLNNSYHFILERRDAGLNGSMQFTYRNPLRSTSPDLILKGARSIVTFALPITLHETTGELILPHLLARYARKDYYGILRNVLEEMKVSLGALGVNSKVVLDSNELIDKEVAVRSGIGSYLKNSLVNVPGIGSATILGNLVVDVALPRTNAPDRLVSCGRCRICVDSCPTSAIGDNGAIDARRCISWILQSPEEIDTAILPAIGTRLYGCDICQDVCPINRRSAYSKHEKFQEIDEIAVEVLRVFCLSDEAILSLLPHIYIYKRDVRLVRRNCIVAAANLEVGSKYEGEIVAEVTKLEGADPLYKPYVDYFFSTRNGDRVTSDLSS